MKKSILSLLLALLPLSAFSQTTYNLGVPLQLERGSGCNKVLCLKNGCTLLFHFEPSKKILVKAFDTTHRETGSDEAHYEELDINNFYLAEFKGMYEINGQGVLFFDQDSRNGRHRLIRLQYSGKTGKLLKEEVMMESKGPNKRTYFYVMKNRDDSGYAVFYFLDLPHLVKENHMHISYYNKDNVMTRDVPLTVDRKKYDYVDVVCAQSQPQGVLVTVCLSKTDVWGVPDRKGPQQPGSATYTKFLEMFYVPANSSSVYPTLVKWPSKIFPDYGLYAYNTFDNTLNMVLYCHNPIFYQMGLNRVTGNISSSTFFKIDEQSGKVGALRIKNEKATEMLKPFKDSSKAFDGLPLMLYTDDAGLTTLISTSYVQNGEPETRAQYEYEDYPGNIVLTQLNDNGAELWGAMLPFSQYFQSYTRHYDELGKALWWQQQSLLNDRPEQVYNRQFVSVACYKKGYDIYMVFNDYNKNFDKGFDLKRDTVYDFNRTNAWYFKLDRKKTMTRHLMFGIPKDKEYHSIMVEGGDFDPDRGIYASLVQENLQGSYDLRMAWVKLE